METIIIDTREKFEYATGHVKGSINIPPAKFLGTHLPKDLDGVDPDQTILVYCRTGSRSNVVANILRSHGFTNVINGINQQRAEQMLKRN